MLSRILALVICVTFSFGSLFVSAEEGYIGEDLGYDIYKRIDEGIYKVKRDMIESRLKDSALLFNGIVGMICTGKNKEKIFCFKDRIDFTASELEDIVGGGLGAIYTHMNPESIGIDTEQAVRIRGLISEYYKTLYAAVTYEQKKLQEVGSIGLFTDGNKDNSSYDLMVDLQDIHNVIFAHDIPYNGTANMGASSVTNLLANAYSPSSPLDGILPWDTKKPQTSTGSKVSTGSTLPGLLNTGSECTPTESLPLNLDADFLRDAESQLLIGKSPKSSIAFSDDGKLPEYWARLAKWGSSGSAGSGFDTFPCSGKDFFCITVSMVMYTQNILAGGKAATIEKVLDENLKIADKYAGSSFTLTKMPKMFFGLSAIGLDLPSMLHIGVQFSTLPPPLLNLKPPTSTSTWPGSAPSVGSATSGLSKGESDEMSQILVCAFEESWFDPNRVNSLEQTVENRMMNGLTYLTTNEFNQKADTSASMPKSWCVRARQMDLKKSYGDSFNLDLFELHDFTVTFSQQISSINKLIQKMNDKPTH